MLAHDAAMLGVPVDSARLFSGDPDYLLWVDMVVDRVAATHKRIARENKA